MDRNRLAALAGLALIAGGALVLLPRREAFAAAPAGLELGAGSLMEQLQGRLGELGAAAEELAGDLVSSIAPSLWSPPAAAAPYLEAIAQAEARNGIPANLLARVLYQESRFRRDIIEGRTVSSAGAIGIAQFMPSTARQYNVNPYDPFDSIRGAGELLRDNFRALGSWDQAIAAYNWGVGNVTRKGLDSAPRETRNYVAQILGDLGLG